MRFSVWLLVCVHDGSREYWGALGIHSSIDRERDAGLSYGIDRPFGVSLGFASVLVAPG
jgi:hypothetical protein